jgi:hypothetical protein
MLPYVKDFQKQVSKKLVKNITTNSNNFLSYFQNPLLPKRRGF